jgi:Lipocalin-like domain
MKKLVSLILITGLMGTTVLAFSGSPDPDSKQEIQKQLIGAWRLASLEEPVASGTIHKADCTGMLVFTADGKASVQVMYRNAQSASAYAQGGYEASYGAYQIDGSSTMTFHIDGSLVRTLTGKYLERRYEISGNRLTITSTNPNEHWKVVWERF